MRRGWAVAGCLLVLACASDAPKKEVQAESAKRAPASELVFPPTGPIELRSTAPPEGTLYQVFVSYQGRTEFADDRTGASPDDAQMFDEKTGVEIDYRQMPVTTPSASEVASSLILEALKRRTRLMPPGDEHTLEIGDDRLRVMTNDKVATDLRGAQPKQELTPRMLLGKSFALLVADSLGNPKGVTLRGLPAAKKLLASLPLREVLSYVQVGYPDHPVSPGDTWHVKRFLPNPIGRLGLEVDVEMRLVGFEKVGDAPCAHVVLRAREDATKVPSAIGFTFDEVGYQLAGDAWLDLATGEVESLRIDDVARVEYHKTATASAPRARMRYEGRSSLQRLQSLPDSTHWADGSKRFSAVK